MGKPSERDSSEKLQIAVLTFAMTGGGFALVTLVFILFLNPSSRSLADDLTRKYKELTTLLLSQEMKGLRTQERISQVKSGDKGDLDLRGIVGENLTRYQLEYKSFPQAKRVNEGKAGLEETHQQIDLKPAMLTPILQFVAEVKDTKKTIQVESVNITREARAKEKEDDSWTASVTFVDYVSK